MISIIITVLDDYDECQATVKSIRETAGGMPEVIVVDDSSKIPLTVPFGGVKLIRNPSRAGVAASRHIGALHATGDYLLLIDAHMRFEPGWYETALKRIEGKLTTAYCCCCVALEPGQMDMTKAKGSYHGATINFFGPDRNAAGKTQWLEGVWLAGEPVDDLEIPCMMGASYLVPREFYFHVGGLRTLRSWGSDEPYLSLKWWLAGGEIRLLKTVRIGHQFRDRSTYRTDSSHLWYNKLVIADTVLPDAHGQRLVKTFPKHLPDFVKGRALAAADANLLLTDKHYFNSVRTVSFDSYLQKFGIPFPQ